MAQSYVLRAQYYSSPTHKKTSRSVVRWLSGLASLAVVIAVIVVMQPDVLQQTKIEKALVDQANELSGEVAMLTDEGREGVSRRAAQPGVRALEQQSQTMMLATQQRAEGFQAKRSARLANDVAASKAHARPKQNASRQECKG